MGRGRAPNAADHVPGHRHVDSVPDHGDLYRIYTITRRDGTDFNLAYIPDDFQAVHTEDFDPTYMKKLYDYGFEKAAAGYKWIKEPPLQVDHDYTLQ